MDDDFGIIFEVGIAQKRGEESYVSWVTINNEASYISSEHDDPRLAFEYAMLMISTMINSNRSNVIWTKAMSAWEKIVRSIFDD